MTPLRVGLLGCGFMGRTHAQVYRLLPEVELVGAWDDDPERLEAACAEFGCRPEAGLGADPVSAEGIDVVDVCLPTALHARATIAAARAGKHVVCEKPIARTLEEADAMIAACETKGVRLLIGHCIRYWAEYAELRRIVQSGELGALTSLNLTRYGGFPHWSSRDWLSDEAQAGGAVMDMHIHDTDFALDLLGEPDETVSFGTVDRRGVSQVFTTMRFGRCTVHAEGGWNLPAGTPFAMTFRAVFEQGAAIFEGGSLTVYADGEEPRRPAFARMAGAGGGNIDDLGGYALELADFVDALRTGREVTVVTPQSARRSLATVLEETRQVKARL